MLYDSFFDGPRVPLEQVLTNKDWRVAQLTRFSAAVVSVKLNIPGTVKNNPYFQEIFEAGWRELTVGAKSFEKEVSRLTGPEGFIFFDLPAEEIKRRMISFEESHPLGRLFDLDVGNLSRTALGFPPRRCFVCSRPAKECARAERHSPEEIKKAIIEIYDQWKQINR